VHKEAHSFLSDICLFRWHPLKKGKVVFGHTDGSLSVFQPGTATAYVKSFVNAKNMSLQTFMHLFLLRNPEYILTKDKMQQKVIKEKHFKKANPTWDQEHNPE